MIDFNRFVSLAAPDAIEAVPRLFQNQSPPAATDQQPAVTGKLKKPRNPAAPPALGKKENFAVATNPNNLQPHEIQATLDATLTKFVEDAGSPERQAGMLIKIGLYRNELAKYLPMIRDADEDMAKQVLDAWFDAGDSALKKAMVNAESGAEEFPLAKAAISDGGPELELAKMVEAASSPQRQMAILQTIGDYTLHLQTALAKMDAVGITDADREAALAEWVAAGDGSHRELKKQLVAIQTNTRLAKKAAQSETDVVEEHMGNAPSHVGTRIGQAYDSRLGYTHNGTGEGAGPRKKGTVPAPDQADAPGVNVASGPNDTGDGGVNPTIKIKRKGTTGGLGSVAGAETATDTTKHVDAKGNMVDDDGNTEKGSDLAVELVKFIPATMMAELRKIDPETQVQIMEVSAQHAADLMAWSSAMAGKLQKSALDSAITDWLKADPDTIQLKKWTAEALATAEEIPLDLAREIMGWAPPAAAAPGARLRSRYNQAA